MQLAVENDLRTIAFPAISCGAYRYPITDAAKIAVETTSRFLREDSSIAEVTFVVSTDEIESAYQGLLG